MANLNAGDIRQLCAYVRHLSNKAHWQWKGLPVICWEFATIEDFVQARAELLSALTPMMLDMKNATRRISSEISEIDCHGVTFRLICKQRLMTTHGPYGASEL